MRDSNECNTDEELVGDSEVIDEETSWFVSKGGPGKAAGLVIPWVV